MMRVIRHLVMRTTLPVRATLLAIAALLAGSGCVVVPEKDYSAFRASMPRSILVLPPLNETVEAGASYSYLTVASEAIGEMGYYVFPVGVIDAFMKENGLPGPAEMHSVSLNKIDEIIGPDAVLYITLQEFGQKFELLSSTTRVRARAELVDVKSGQSLWTNTVNHSESNSSSGGGLLGDILSAAVAQSVGTISDKSHDSARLAHSELITRSGEGLLFGPRHRNFGTEEFAGAGEAGLVSDVPASDADTDVDSDDSEINEEELMPS